MPGLKAAAAGLDIGSILSGLYQPIGPLRTLPRIQKAIEICGELRSLGNSLLSAIEKQDAEQLAQLRQTHELALHQMNQNVRFLQWKQAEQATDSLLNTRATTLERYRFYLRLLGLTPDSKNAPDKLPIDRRELTEDTFDNAYAALVGEYDLPIPLETYPPLQLAQGQSPASESGAAGDGQLFLNVSEDAELNQHMPTARDTQLASSVVDTIAGILQFIPDFTADLAFWGLGASTGIFGGDKLAASLKTNAEILRTISQWEQAQGGMAARKAGYQRRADDWLLQANLAARELRQMGLQIISSLIAEQVAFQEYSVTKAQVGQAQDVLQFLQSKSTNVDFYGLMVGDLSDLYYQFYRLAIDAGRKAEQTMKWELMRPELDANTYVQPSYWESGRKGLLSGESLMLDLKRMEADYHDNNKREIDLTAHISLRQLDPLALLILKATGSCTFTVTEAYFARTIPSLYMLRIVSAAISTPSVVGPYTSINCALTLQSSTVRIKPGLRSGSNYVRDLLNQDDRFLDSFGSVDVLVTSSGTSDGGTFSPNDDRFRPFEGQGACATWHLSLPSPELPPFSYASISDVILDLQIRAREGGAELGNKAFDWLKTTLQDASNAGLGLLFSLRYDFPTEWAAADAGNKDLTFVVQKSYFPYMVQGRAISLSIGSLSLYGADAAPLASIVVDTTAMAAALNDPSNGSFKVTVPAGTFQPGADAFLIMQYGATWP